jgi:hypothetical protein
MALGHINLPRTPDTPTNNNIRRPTFQLPQLEKAPSFQDVRPTDTSVGAKRAFAKIVKAYDFWVRTNVSLANLHTGEGLGGGVNFNVHWRSWIPEAVQRALGITCGQQLETFYPREARQGFQSNLQVLQKLNWLDSDSVTPEGTKTLGLHSLLKRALIAEDSKEVTTTMAERLQGISRSRSLGSNNVTSGLSRYRSALPTTVNRWRRKMKRIW